MDSIDKEHVITDVETLERLYGFPSGAAVEKEVSYIHPHYRRMIESSPFVVLATSGPGGLDTSPRGDPAGFVTVDDEKTLLIPDRRGWRSKLWDSTQHIERTSLPSLGTMLGDISASRIDPATYDQGLYERLKASLY